MIQQPAVSKLAGGSMTEPLNLPQPHETEFERQQERIKLNQKVVYQPGNQHQLFIGNPNGHYSSAEQFRAMVDKGNKESQELQRRLQEQATKYNNKLIRDAQAGETGLQDNYLTRPENAVVNPRYEDRQPQQAFPRNPYQQNMPLAASDIIP